ncbi:MAG: hypothetical protein IT368_08750 [Candidatus Hydrogenedentes bacterium]|nr:hypothetical protein [Candidatus Hydrogenedentota bacterium]
MSLVCRLPISILVVALLLGCARNAARPILDPGITDSTVFAPAAPPEEGYEPPPVFHPGEFLSPGLLVGPHYVVEETVYNDGFTNHYLIRSDFGDFAAQGVDEARTRIREVQAIATLRELEQSEAFAKAVKADLKDFALGPYRTIRRVVTNPLYAVGAVPGDAIRALSLMKEAGELIASGFSREYAKDLIGFTDAKRDLARLLDIDPDSPNPVLQEDLNRIAWSFYGGGAPMRIAEEFIPGLPGLVFEVVEDGAPLGKAVDEVFKQFDPRSTRNRLKRLDLPRETRTAFMGHPHFTSDKRGRIAEALDSLGDTMNRAAFIELALAASSRGEAGAFVKKAEMLAAYDERVLPIRAIHTGAGQVQAHTTDDVLLTVLVHDHVAWTRAWHEQLDRLGRSPEALEVRRQELWLSGGMTDRARMETEAHGFRVYVYTLSFLERPWGGSVG